MPLVTGIYEVMDLKVLKDRKDLKNHKRPQRLQKQWILRKWGISGSKRKG